MREPVWRRCCSSSVAELRQPRRARQRRAGCSAAAAAVPCTDRARRARRRVIPAPTLSPISPRTTTVPPVMYSHAWSPAPSTTAVAPELRTAKRSPALPRHVELAARRAVQRRVADQDRARLVVRLRDDGDAAAAHALADAVVRLADELELHTCGEEGAEALAGRAVEACTHAAGRSVPTRSGGRSPSPSRAPTARSLFVIR